MQKFWALRINHQGVDGNFPLLASHFQFESLREERLEHQHHLTAVRTIAAPKKVTVIILDKALGHRFIDARDDVIALIVDSLWTEPIASPTWPTEQPLVLEIAVAKDPEVDSVC